MSAGVREGVEVAGQEQEYNSLGQGGNKVEGETKAAEKRDKQGSFVFCLVITLGTFKR